eukprot:ANDGO_03778.mRNA.1 Centromere protein W OS=Gallus gallus GN=CENPW PE=1 SV=1
MAGVPKSTLKNIFKRHAPAHRLSRNSELMMYLNYVLFMRKLSQMAQTESTKDGSKIIRGRHVQAAAQRIMDEMK